MNGCAVCGTAIEPSPTGKRRMYCSLACKTRASYLRNKQGYLERARSGRLARRARDLAGERAMGRAKELRRRLADPEAARQRSRAENVRNYDRYIAYAHQYYRDNTDDAIARAHLRRARLLSAGERYTAAEWRELCLRVGGRCLCCGVQPERLSPDHVIPIARGGRNTIDNIQPLCRPCNQHKGIATTDYRRQEAP